jgi:intracellular multiplication protein IcmL
MSENKKKIPAKIENKEELLSVNNSLAEVAIADTLIRNIFVRERHYFILRLLFISLFINIFMVSIFVYEAIQPTQYVYFATDQNGRVVPLKSLSDPVLDQTEVGDWATDQIVKAFTFDYANYQTALASTQNAFTSNGWLAFQNSLKDANILSSVIANKYVATATPNEAPTMLADGIVDGHYAWKFQIPITVSFQGDSGQFSQVLNLTVLIVRQPETSHPNGLGIEQLRAD